MWEINVGDKMNDGYDVHEALYPTFEIRDLWDICLGPITSPI